MEELGEPVAYLALKEGTPVYDRQGQRIGVVEHVLADEPTDIFHGLIVHTSPLPGRHLYADADQIAQMREGGVVVTGGRDDLHDPEPRPDTPRRPDEGPVDGPLQAALRRAWDWLTSTR